MKRFSIFVCVASWVVASTALASQQSPDQQMQAGFLPCQQAGSDRENGWRQLAWETMKRTSVECDMQAKQVDPESVDLYKTPLLIWTCDGPVADLSEEALANLRRHLTLGGFLFVDNPKGLEGKAFTASIESVMVRLFPKNRLNPIAHDHVLYKTFFLIQSPAGRLEASPVLTGIQVDSRLVVVFSQNDLLGAVSRDLYGSWEFVVEPGGDLQRERSFRMGINLLFYALCMDYKNDRVHLPFILKRRRL